MTTEEVFLNIFLAISTILTILGNLIIILAIIKDKKLHKPRNYLILSLAITDLLVGLIVMPVQSFIKPKLSGHWLYGLFLCEIYGFISLTVIQTSMQHLLMIALDRYWSLTDIAYFYRMTNCKVGFMIATAWIFGMAPAIPYFFSRYPRFVEQVMVQKKCPYGLSTTFNIISTTISYWIPLFIVTVIYGLIFKVCS